MERNSDQRSQRKSFEHTISSASLTRCNLGVIAVQRMIQKLKESAHQVSFPLMDGVWESD